MNSYFILPSIIIPIIGALFILVMGKKIRAPFALFIAIVTFLSVGRLIPAITQRGVFISDYFIVDGLSVFFALVSSLVGALIVLYSIGYMSKYQNLREYYFLVTLFIGSMMGLVFSANLLLIYIFWEIAAICSWRLIGFYREEKDIKAANKAFLITFSAASIMLAGFVTVYLDTKSFNLNELRGTTISNLAFILIFIGIMAKSCVFPLHTWLPTAGVAPTPVTAFLHAAVLVKIGIYGFARLFCWAFQVPQILSIYIPFLAVVSGIIAGCSALRETDIKRILAYSTISQLGFILLGLTILSPIGITGALLFILAHALGKAGLFLCAGIIEHKTGMRNIRNLSGMMKVLPVTAIAFSVCALSVAGIPPFAGFWGKLLIVTAPIKEGQFILAGLAILTCMLTFLYLLRLFNTVFLGAESHSQVVEGSKLMLISVCILAILSLMGGILVNFPGELIEITREQIMKLR